MLDSSSWLQLSSERETDCKNLSEITGRYIYNRSTAKCYRRGNREQNLCRIPTSNQTFPEANWIAALVTFIPLIGHYLTLLHAFVHKNITGLGTCDGIPETTFESADRNTDHTRTTARTLVR